MRSPASTTDPEEVSDSPSSRPLTVVWDDRFEEYDFGPSHPFQESSRALAVRLLEELDFFAPADPLRATLLSTVDPAPRAILAGFHAAEYLDLVERLSDSGRSGYLDSGDTPAFPGCFQAAARIVGGTLRALEELRSGPTDHALAPAGGLHHAHQDRASGFCVFNDVAVAIVEALGPGARFRRVAYIDIDAHHGDGVMYGFYDDVRLLNIDFHQDGRTLFPGTGDVGETGTGAARGLKVNVPLPPGSDDGVFLPLFNRIVPPLVREFRPELIIFQHGVDGHSGDPLARLQLSHEAYAGADRLVHQMAHEVAAGRLLVTGGGGYDPRVVALVLARAALELSNGPSAVAGQVTPITWRREFSERTGVTAPVNWSEAGRFASKRRSVDRVVESILAKLEAAHGRAFPPT